MKLQINVSGAWRDIATFHANQLQDVQEATVALGKALNCGKFRITGGGERSPEVLGYLEAPYRMWVAA